MTDMTQVEAVKVDKNQTRRRMMSEFWFYFSENKGAVIGLWVFLFLVAVALFAPLVSPHEPNHQ